MAENTPTVGLLKVEEGREDVKENVYKAVRKAMELSDWKRHLLAGEETLIKVNVTWCDYLLPGMCTSPWVLAGLIEVIQDHVGEISVGEGLAAAFQSFEKGCRINRYDRVAEEYGVKLINLSKEEYIKTDARDLGVPFPITLSKKVVDVPNLISACPMKTHSVTTYTGVMKNLFGISFGKRITYHLYLDSVIVGINRAVKANYAVLDGTVCIEGDGPCNGIPKEKDVVLASDDLVAADATGCRIMGINPEEVSYLKIAEKAGLGSLKPELKGNVRLGDVQEKFLPAGPQAYYERGMLPLLKNPLLSDIAYNYLWNPGRFFVRHYRNLWYYHQGRKNAGKFLKKSRYAGQWM